MRPSRLSYGFLLTFLVCLFVLRWWQLPAYPWQIYACLSALTSIGIVASVLRPAIAMFPAMTFGCIVAFLLASKAVHVTTPLDIEALGHGQKATVHGWVVDPPDVRPMVTKLVIGVDRVTDEDGIHEARGRILVSDNNAWPPRLYGDEVTVYGTLPNVSDHFDYPNYLELSGIRALIMNGRISSADEGRPQPASARTYRVIGWLTALRTFVEDRIGVILPEPHASLMAGLLTGSRRGLPQKLSDAFRISGLTHIVAVSGSNVTIVLTVLGSMLFWLPLKKRFWALCTGAIAFMLFVGAGAPVVRATVMGILGLIALQTNRMATPRLLVLWTAFLMLLWNPLQLWYDASFQLSFLAIAGILELSPVLLRVFRFVPETLGMQESLVATVAAQIGTLPVSIIIFRQFSLIAPVTNILVAPLIPLAMLTGTVSFIASLWMPLGLVTGYVAWALLQMIILIVKTGAAVPYAAVFF